MAGEKAPRFNARLKQLAVAFAVTLVIGVLGLVSPLNSLLWAFQARMIQHEASGDIVYVGAASNLADPANAGARAMVADTIDRLSAAGARRIFLDIPFEHPASAREDALLNEAARRSDITAFVDRYATRSGGELLIFPTPSVGRGVPSVVRKEWVDLFGYTWTAPVSVTVGGVSYPSFPAALAGRATGKDESFQIDYSTSYSSIPSFTLSEARDALAASGTEAFLGKTVVIGMLPREGAIFAPIPGFAKVPESYIGIYAAETLKRGAMPRIGWYVPVFILGMALGLACLRARHSGRRRGYLGAAAVLAAIFVAGPLLGSAVELLETIALLLIFGGIRLWHLLYRHAPQFNRLSGLPTFEKLERDLGRIRAGKRNALVIAKIHRFEDVLASLPRDKHAAYLQLIAGRLKVAEESATVYSSGGPYFAWLQGYESRDELVLHLRGMRAIFASGLNVDGLPVDVGITFSADTGDDTDAAKRISSALAAADKTTESQNPVVLADQASDADRLWSISLQARLDEAMKTGEIYLVYQPQFDLDTGRLYGAEALARWQDPERGEIPTSYFIEQCEQVGRMDALTRKVFDEALATVSDSPFASTDFNLSMNVSATMLSDFEIVKILEESLGRSHLSPANVTIEMTETARIADLRRASAVLSDLKALGVRLSADDFGVGAASFEPFLELPFDELKIDRLFVAQIVRDAKARRIVEHLVRLGKDLEIRVLAEGVEDQATLEILKSLGCPAAQGYKLGRPTSLMEIYRAQTSANDEDTATGEQAKAG